MPLHRLDALTDPRLEPYRHLKQTNLTRWTGRFIAEGKRVVARLLASRYRVESVLLSEKRLPLTAELGIPPGVDVLVVPEVLGTELTGYSFHGGVLACGMRGELLTAQQLVKVPPAMLVACPHMTDPDNLGSLMRLCRAFGVGGLLLGSACCDPFSRRTLRVSMGNAFELPIVECADLAADLDWLRTTPGYTLTATVLTPDAIPLQQAARLPRDVLLLGNEAHGLDAEWVSRSDRRVTIPMQPGADSLNVTIAAGICLHWLTSTSGFPA